MRQTYNFNEKRRNYYIAKKFQRNFILKFCGLVALGSFLSGIIIDAMSTATVSMTFENSRLILKSTADFILPAVLLSSAIVMILMGIATVFIVLFTSHKIAGALYRLEKDVEQVTYGNFNMRFKLRRDDEIKALAVSIDVMAQVLKSRMVEVKAICAELEQAVPSGEARGKVEKLRKALDKFRTE